MKALYYLGKLGLITGLVIETVYFPTVTYAQSVTEQRICLQDGEYAVFAQHPLFWGAWNATGLLNYWLAPEWRRVPNDPIYDPIYDIANIQLSHEHIFFCNNRKIVDNIGFGPNGRFQYTAQAIQSGKEQNGGRVDNFVPIDRRKYDPGIVREVLENGLAILPNQCEIRPGENNRERNSDRRAFDDRTYKYVVDNCQGFTARIREEYWKRIFVGMWESEAGSQVQIRWDSTSNQYQAVITKLSSQQQEAGFSVGELNWTARFADNPSQMNDRIKWRRGRNRVSSASFWRDGIVDLDRSTVNIIITSQVTWHRVNK